MAKIYFEEEDRYGDAIGRTLSHWKEKMREEDISQLKLYEGKIEYDSDHFYCDEYFAVGLKSERGCGKICEGYKPRNGKNGRCMHSKNCYDITDKFIILKK